MEYRYRNTQAMVLAFSMHNYIFIPKALLADAKIQASTRVYMHTAAKGHYSPASTGFVWVGVSGGTLLIPVSCFGSIIYVFLCMYNTNMMWQTVIILKVFTTTLVQNYH